jgi:enoyl-CoA hydratase/carnithine racemase
MFAQPQVVRFGSVALVEQGTGFPLHQRNGVSSGDLSTPLLQVADQLRSAGDLSVVVLSLPGEDAVARPLPVSWQRVLNAWSTLRITTIAALSGTLAGPEVALAAVLDFRIAARSTVLTTYCCGTGARCLHPRLAEACGVIRSFELSPHHPIRAPEALMAGLVDTIVAPGQVVNEALKWGQRIAGRPDTVRIMAKLAIRARGRLTGGTRDAMVDCPVAETEDQRTGT